MKDTIEEAPGDALGPGDLAWSRRIDTDGAETFWRVAAAAGPFDPRGALLALDTSEPADVAAVAASVRERAQQPRRSRASLVAGNGRRGRRGDALGPAPPPGEAVEHALHGCVGSAA